MIRNANHEDMPGLLRMAASFGAVAGLPAPLCAASMEQTFTGLMEAPLGVLLVNDDVTAAAGAVVTPAYYNLGHMTGQELFWWVDENARGGVGLRLFKALEDEVRRLGAESFVMVALENIKPGQTSTFYLRNGYRPLERNYIRSL